jgi:hypothetical protein
MIAASSIHGTGAQNFAKALRRGSGAVSGVALGPDFSNLLRASPLVSPFEGDIDSRQIALRPETNWNTSTITARTSRICTNPPNVYDVTSPSSHNTSRITKIVQSMFLLSFETIVFVLLQCNRKPRWI